MAAVAAAEGHAPATRNAAAKGWIDRMGQSMAVGQTFRRHYDAGRPQAGAKKVTTPSGSASGIVMPVSSTA